MNGAWYLPEGDSVVLGTADCPLEAVGRGVHGKFPGGGCPNRIDD